jgi:tetratricopeptide (TPR) repeat protein
MLALALVVLGGLLLAASNWLGIGPWSEYRAGKAAIDRILSTGRMQSDRAEHESAFRTYQGLLKIDPGNGAAMDLQLRAAMAWVRDFRVVAADGAKAADTAGALLAEIMPVLDAGLARANGQQPRAAADILAHIGWAHWLNERIAHREFGPAAERDLRQALRADPSNVFANAMLANWIMQTGGRAAEALRHFQIAVQRNKERPFVRKLQLGAMIYPRDSETRLALIRVANEMRRNGEPIGEQERRRILALYSPTVNSAEELYQTLSAVPAGDAWATYSWLDDQRTGEAGSDSRRIQQEFIRAGILELEGRREDALAAFGALRGELKRLGYDGRIARHVDSAVTRLSHR